MTALNNAARLYKGASLIANAYVGTTMVWPKISSSYAVFDAATASAVLLTGGNLNIKNTGSGTIPSGARVANASAKTTGKFYYEATMTLIATGGSIGFIGIGTTSSDFAALQSNGTTGIALHYEGQVWSVGGVVGTIGGLATGSKVALAVDLDNRKAWFRILPSGLWNNSGSANPATNVGGYTIPSGSMVPFVTFGGASSGPGNIVKTNLGHYVFLGTSPSGFTAGWTV